jgi:uncharacterized protein (DUF433 family)
MEYEIAQHNYRLFVTLKKDNDGSPNKYVEVEKELAGGVPVFKGTRVTAKTLFDYLEEESLKEFLKGFPSVTRTQSEGVIEMAAEKFITEFIA